MSVRFLHKLICSPAAVCRWRPPPPRPFAARRGTCMYPLLLRSTDAVSLAQGGVPSPGFSQTVAELATIRGDDRTCPKSWRLRLRTLCHLTSPVCGKSGLDGQFAPVGRTAHRRRTDPLDQSCVMSFHITPSVQIESCQSHHVVTDDVMADEVERARIHCRC